MDKVAGMSTAQLVRLFFSRLVSFARSLVIGMRANARERPWKKKKKLFPIRAFRPRYSLQSSSFSLCGKEGVELSAQGCLNCKRDFSKLSNRGDNGWDVADCLLPVLLSTAPDGFFYFFVFDLDPCSRSSSTLAKRPFLFCSADETRARPPVLFARSL